jgi:diguanylate cyclase (GGDEF)-like protein
MATDRPMRTVLLSLLYGVSGIFSLLNAAWPVSPQSPVVLGLVLGLVGLLGAGYLWWRGGRLTDAEVSGALVLGGGLVAVLASQSMTRAGVVALGPIVITVCLYAGWFLPLAQARVHAALIIAMSSLGAVLARPDHLIVFWLVAVVTAAALTEIQGRLAEGLRQAATTDPLTGLVNRRAWQSEAGRVLAHAVRTGEPLTIALVDLDNFKEVNDRSGHEAGDLLLRELSTRWSGELRQADVLGRYGGDEFVLCLPDTDAAGTAEILARLEACHPFSWSVGTATAVEGDTLESMLSRADAELYEHKRRSPAG